MSERPTLRRSLTVSALLMLAVAGCQVAAPVAKSPEATVGANTGNAHAKAGAPGANVTAQAPTVDSPLPSREQALAGAVAQSVTAKSGALYQSNDGSLQATIPPGALTTDARVRFAAGDTSKLPANPLMTAGIAFVMDLGGAQLKPGMAIMVKAKVDPRFVKEFQASAPNVDPASRGLSQDAQGTWYLTMPVKNVDGPNAERTQTSQLAGDAALVELIPAPVARTVMMAASTSGSGGSAPTPTPTDTPTPTPVPTATPTPAPTPEPTLPTTQTDDSVVNGYPAMPVSQAGNYSPITQMTVKALGNQYSTTLTVYDTVTQTMGSGSLHPEWIYCFVGHGWCAQTSVTQAVSDVVRYTKAVKSNHLPPADLTTRAKSYSPAWDCSVGANLVSFNVKAEYDSDDPAVVASTPNVQVVVNGGGNTITQPTTNGTTTVQAGLGTALGLYAYLQAPSFYTQSPVTNVTATSTTGTVKVTIPKFNPQINVHMDADASLPGTITVQYTITDPATGSAIPGSQTVSVSGAGTASGDAVVKPNVPGDSSYSFKLTGLSGTDVRDNGQMPAGVSVYRTGSFQQNVKIIGVAVK